MISYTTSVLFLGCVLMLFLYYNKWLRKRSHIALGQVETFSFEKALKKKLHRVYHAGGSNLTEIDEKLSEEERDIRLRVCALLDSCKDFGGYSGDALNCGQVYVDDLEKSLSGLEIPCLMIEPNRVIVVYKKKK